MNITTSDLINFKKKHYLPKNTMLIVSGKFDVEQMLQIIKNTLNVNIIVDETKLCKELTTNEKLIFNTTKNKTIKISDRISHVITNDSQNQTIIQINFPCYKKFNKYNQYTSILCSILANGISGRLIEEIRIKQGLTYSVDVDCVEFNEFGIFSISLGVQNDKVIRAFDAIFAVLRNLKETNVTELELNKAKNQQMTTIMITFQKQLSYFAYYMQMIYYRYEISQLGDIIEDINNITANNIDDVIQQIFNFKQTYIVMLGSEKINLKQIKKAMFQLK